MCVPRVTGPSRANLFRSNGKIYSTEKYMSPVVISIEACKDLSKYSTCYKEHYGVVAV